ncbi:hypothetical protein RRG08_056007 [Elysia crispata]|uniref:Uncharacterized protein n=1 Tax=Elysia crispata TaxID=231223 RepID=A0AAE1AHM9_9GAST|nr:hypothetical protein RRG08_056007 [Elysia crispata]
MHPRVVQGWVIFLHATQIPRPRYPTQRSPAMVCPFYSMAALVLEVTEQKRIKAVSDARWVQVWPAGLAIKIRASGCRLPMSGLLHARSVTAGLELTVRLARGRGVCDAALDKEDVPDGGARCRMDGAHQWNATAVSGWGMTGGAGILEE